MSPTSARSGEYGESDLATGGVLGDRGRVGRVHDDRHQAATAPAGGPDRVDEGVLHEDPARAVVPRRHVDHLDAVALGEVGGHLAGLEGQAHDRLAGTELLARGGGHAPDQQRAGDEGHLRVRLRHLVAQPPRHVLDAGAGDLHLLHGGQGDRLPGRDLPGDPDRRDPVAGAHRQQRGGERPAQNEEHGEGRQGGLAFPGRHREAPGHGCGQPGVAAVRLQAAGGGTAVALLAGPHGCVTPRAWSRPVTPRAGWTAGPEPGITCRIRNSRHYWRISPPDRGEINDPCRSVMAGRRRKGRTILSSARAAEVAYYHKAWFNWNNYDNFTN